MFGVAAEAANWTGLALGTSVELAIGTVEGALLD